MSKLSQTPFWSGAQQALLRTFVGRDSALSALETSLREASTEPRIVWCSGPSGLGKTALAQVMAARVRAQGASALLLSVSSLAEVLRTDTAPITSLGHAPHADLLILDAYESAPAEVQQVVDALLPSAGAHLLVLVTALSPPPARIRSQLDAILRLITLRPLSEDEALDLLARRGVAPAQRAELAVLGGGIPSALTELAERARADRPTPINERSPHELAEVITANLVRNIPSPAHRHALEALTVVPMLDAPLLQRMLACTEHTADEGVFLWLGSHAFVVRDAQGLTLHPRVCDALHREFCMRDPVLRRAMGRVAVEVLEARMAMTPVGVQHRLYLDQRFAERDLHRLDHARLLRARTILIATAREALRDARRAAQKLDPAIEACLAESAPHLEVHALGRAEGQVDLVLCIDKRDPQHPVARFVASAQRSEASRGSVTLFTPAHLAAVAFARAHVLAQQAPLLSLELPLEVERDLAPLGFLLVDETHPARALFTSELLLRTTQAAAVATTKPALQEPEAPSLPDEKTLGIALRHALASRFDPQALRRSTLLSLQLIQASNEAPEHALPALLDHLCRSLAEAPAYASSARLLEVTYLDAQLPKQEAAAVDLGLPFGTYRYQLRRALDLATKSLLRLEEEAVIARLKSQRS